jgi:Ca-activated chloride channel family protein
MAIRANLLPRLAVSILALLAAGPVVAEGPAEAKSTAAAIDALPERQKDFLRSVEVLISPKEQEIFLSLREVYQRDAFIRRFWKVRDPYPRTEQNELQERWESHLRQARQELGEIKSERALTLIFFGEPTRRLPVACNVLREQLEVWFYDQGAEPIRQSFSVIFLGRGERSRRWRPIDGFSSLFDINRSIGKSDAELVELASEDCVRSSELFSAVGQALDLNDSRVRALWPTPSDEWALAFAARTTDLKADALPLDVNLELSFPGRNQSRTVVQGYLTVPRGQLAPTKLGEHDFYNLIVDGEVLRQGELFESFRYRFDFPADGAPETVPLILQRYLRPGPYRLILRVEDAASARMSRSDLELEVPRFDPATAAAAAPPVAPPPAAAGAAEQAAKSPEQEAAEQEARQALVDAALQEANASLSTGDQSIKIVPLRDGLQLGKVRVEARTRGEGIAKVAFELNGRRVMSKSAPPYSMELDLGPKPRLHRLRAVAEGENGDKLADDQTVLNAGPHRFALRLIEPQLGKSYQQSLRVHAEVEVPEGEKLDRVEIFLEETRVATLYQPPFEQPILLDKSGALSYVRAVAFLEDGNTAEDVSFVNAPDFVDELEVQFVELYAAVVDRKGDFVDGLTAEDFTVSENGVPQQIRRFEAIRDLPIRAGLVIDTSLSMEPLLKDVEKAAYRFLETVIKPRDRAAVITFNDKPRLAVRFTSEQPVLAGGLAGLTAEGETALYDTLVYSLHYFSGLSGKRTLVVLTDGADSRSTYTYEDALEFARRAGVSIYVIGMGLPSSQREARGKMIRLANETGGEAYFIDGPNQLGRIYDQVQLELRAQYLLAYQSSHGSAGRDSKDKDEFREVAVKIGKPGLEVKAMKGYFP